jgi:hypothetical protein
MAHALRQAVLLSMLAIPLAQGQNGGAIRLQLRPHAGDTLRVRLDQTIETSRPTSAADTLAKPTDLASLTLLARIAIEGSDASGATALALADSVRVTSSGSLESSPTLRGARALQGQRFRFRILPDGATLLVGGGRRVAA